MNLLCHFPVPTKGCELLTTEARKERMNLVQKECHARNKKGRKDGEHERVTNYFNSVFRRSFFATVDNVNIAFPNSPFGFLSIVLRAFGAGSQ